MYARGGGILVGVNGLGFLSPASGYTIMNNSYANNFASFTLGNSTLVPRDVWLYSNASDNEVMESSGTVVLDSGTGNTVILTP